MITRLRNWFESNKPVLPPKLTVSINLHGRVRLLSHIAAEPPFPGGLIEVDFHPIDNIISCDSGLLPFRIISIPDREFTLFSDNPNAMRWLLSLGGTYNDKSLDFENFKCYMDGGACYFESKGFPILSILENSTSGNFMLGNFYKYPFGFMIGVESDLYGVSGYRGQTAKMIPAHLAISIQQDKIKTSFLGFKMEETFKNATQILSFDKGKMQPVFLNGKNIVCHLSENNPEIWMNFSGKQDMWTVCSIHSDNKFSVSFNREWPL